MSSAISGVELVPFEHGSIVLVRSLSEELKAHLRTRLSQMCFGIKVNEDPDYYSFQRTAAEFLARFKNQTPKTQLGMVGELFIHLFADEIFEDLENSSVYFNKEERSIKKGFDLTFFDSADRSIWYAETKSGRLRDQSLQAKARALLSKAANDLADKLSDSSRRSLWDAAILDAEIMLTEPHSKTVKQILRSDSLGPQSSSRHNALLSVAVFHPLLPLSLQASHLKNSVESLIRAKRFRRVRLIAVQKATVEKIVKFFEESSLSDASA